MQREAATRPTLIERFVDREGRLTPGASLILDGMWRNTAPGFPAVPCLATTTTNVVALTPILTEEGGVDIANHMAFVFVADASLSGAGTVTLGGLGPFKLYANDGATQATTGHVVAGRLYVGVFNEALDSGAGGLVLIGVRDTAGILGVSAFMQTVLDDANAAAALSTLGAQPLDSDLTAIAALATTTFGRSLLTQANAAAARGTLEIETGTFTPTMAFATPGTSSFTYTQQEGRYLKVSQWYIIQLVLQVTPTIGTGSGEIRIGGLPAAAAINSQPGVFGVFGGSLLTWPASRTQLVPLFRLGQTYMVMEAHGSAVGGSTVTAANLTGGSNTLIRLSGVFDT